MENVPSLKDFMKETLNLEEIPAEGMESVPYLQKVRGEGRKVFIETYGCQMNVSDSEIVQAVMNNAGFDTTSEMNEADIIFLNTCAIRDKAEMKIWERLKFLKHLRTKKKKNMVVGVLGCMAERLKTKLLESDKLVDIVAGPDAYRDLPRLVETVEEMGEPAINVLLSQDETYADITPVRTATNGVSAFVSIMRGCNNMCSYCIVPFTRGRERSRAVSSIEEEVRILSEQGFKEIVLLGQNVNSYNYIDEENVVHEPPPMSDGFTSLFKKKKTGFTFAQLIDRVSQVDPEMRIRFTSPHPKDFPTELLTLIKERPNICNSIHIPAQSGSSTVLERMRRGYTKEVYLELIDKIKETIPDCALSSDFISGFCGETEEEHLDTISLLETVKYDQAFMFAYSLREKTHAHRRLEDDVPPEVKNRRLQEVIATFSKYAKEKFEHEIGRKHLILIEGKSKKSDQEWSGRTDTNKMVIIPDEPLVDLKGNKSKVQPGDYIEVVITHATSHSLRGNPVKKTTLQQFHSSHA